MGFANRVMNAAFTQAQSIINSAWRRTRAFVRREEAVPAAHPADNMAMQFHQNRRHAIKGYFNTIVFTPNTEMPLAEAANACRSQVIRNITRIFNETVAENNRDRIHFVIIVRAKYHRVDTEGETLETNLAHSSKKFSLVRTSDLATAVTNAFNYIQEQIDVMQERGSGWEFDYVNDISVDTAKFRYQRGSSYIDLPANIKAKKACVNIKNPNDDKCFVWSVLAALHPATTHVDRLSNYKTHEKSLNLTGLSFPMCLSKIGKFEQLNPTLAINVMGLHGKDHEVVPLLASSKKGRCEINLLLFEESGKKHYVLIKNMLRLLNRDSFRNLAYCPRCLSGFPSEEKMRDHQKNGCDTTKECKAILPEADKAFIQFKDYTKQQRVPYVIYADTEAILPITRTSDSPTIRNATQKHVMCSFYYVVVDENGTVVRQKLYRGPDACVQFVDAILAEEKWIMQTYARNVPIIMSDEDVRKHRNAKQCYLCHTAFQTGDENKSMWKVKDHNHITGAYRGALHSKCNISYHNRWTRIPVIFHNGSRYDNHLFVEELCSRDLKVEVIPKTKENYTTIIAGKLQFLDSCCHLASSLDNLVENLKKAGQSMDNFKILHANMTDPVTFLRKGVYPYEYMDSFARFDETQLPPQQAFYSSLVGEGVSDADYAHAQTVFSTKCTTMGDYHDFYLKSDVLLLADVFESYRKLSLQYYQLDPCWYITLPSQSWNNLLKMTGEKVDVFNDQQYDMQLMIEKGTRGGISCIVGRYNEVQPDRSMHYYDANNLYGWAMGQPLPVGDYQWVANDIDISELDPMGDRGYIFEVDITVPDDKHDFLRDYPPAPEHALIKDSMLSPFAKEMKANLGIKADNTEKLILSMRDKKKYVVHYRTLQLYLRLGVIITKVHRVISFRQKAWMKPYIDFNSQKRQQAKTPFEKDFFKLLNNSVFGKTIENVRKRCNCHLYTSHQLPSLTKMADYKSHNIFNKDVCAVEFMKTKIKFDKPIIVGMSILDLSKLLMYESFYEMKRRYPSIKLMMTDTDSLIMDMPKQFDDDLLANKDNLKDMFDCSNFAADHPLFDNTNKAIIGKFKDECAGKRITDFVGLRSKMYALVTDDKKEKKTAKGIGRSAIKLLKFDKYKQVLFDKKQENTSFCTIRSGKHAVYTTKVEKIGLSAYDNKFYMLDNFTSVPYGHYLSRTP